VSNEEVRSGVRLVASALVTETQRDSR